MNKTNDIKSIHWFDLDGTLWQTPAKWWIVDKNDPDKPLLRITQYEGGLILSGHWRGDEKYLRYNGMDGWISKDMWDAINKKKQLRPEDLGVSWREFTDAKIIESHAEDIVFHIDRIAHLRDTNHVINLLTARGNKKAHAILLDKLNSELSTINLNVSESHFVNDPETAVHIQGTTGTRKCLTMLQNIVGFAIEGGQFVPKACEKYDISHFYDDEDKNIEDCHQVNKYLYGLLESTMPKLKDQIARDILERKPRLMLNLVSTNKLNPFTTSEVRIG